MVTQHALTDLRTRFKDVLSYATYTVGAEERRVDDLDVELMEDGRISVVFILKASEKPGEIATKVKLYGTDGECWIESDENISLEEQDSGTGASYRFRFSIVEGEV